VNRLRRGATDKRRSFCPLLPRNSNSGFQRCLLMQPMRLRIFFLSHSGPRSPPPLSVLAQYAQSAQSRAEGRRHAPTSTSTAATPTSFRTLQTPPTTTVSHQRHERLGRLRQSPPSSAPSSASKGDVSGFLPQMTSPNFNPHTYFFPHRTPGRCPLRAATPSFAHGMVGSAHLTSSALPQPEEATTPLPWPSGLALDVGHLPATSPGRVTGRLLQHTR